MRQSGSRSGGPGSPSRRWLVLVSMTVANAMVLVDQTAVPLILPDVMNEFGVGSQMVQWVLNGSLLPLAGLLVLGGRLGDLFGHRRVFIIGAALFAGASACAGFAPDFGILILFRVLQGAGGALMLPTTIAIVSAAYPGQERGRALGLMGGAAAIAGALGPALGGILTSVLDWRAVLLINVPLAILAIVAAFLAVGPDREGSGPRRVDLAGTLLLSLGIIGLVFGLSQSQAWGWSSPGVYGPVILAVVAAVLFVIVERRVKEPLLDFALLRRHPNYLGATISQTLAGMAEMGLGVLFPLLLILNLGMDPGLAGLALIPATLPMIFVAPMAGRWYDRVGGRRPLATGFAVLALSGLVLAWGVHSSDYWFIFPGFLVYGIGLALVLTVNDPVSLDTVRDRDQGQASGVSATAEQFGGALGIALLYLVFHTTYVGRLHQNIDAAAVADLTDAQYAKLRDDIIAAEQTGLHSNTFDPTFSAYLQSALDASQWGMSAAFIGVTLLSLVGLVAVVRLVRKPALEAEGTENTESADSSDTPA
ncbi:MFS transporter [Compostimonas suwonensis]|uniref:EmrB/QacA subfamily drug resistance transporter n=1 Tax=Compostimonas suwonensis TaxID=1048394 RepID=A0A2M9BWD3_9MICO|nr:MFS transporter [Compostimonas suwonensis]PJJ62267.1 EmrB/QacA subfamily drug resistance transporter [Compostimonas suwonensis]